MFCVLVVLGLDAVLCVGSYLYVLESNIGGFQTDGADVADIYVTDDWFISKMAEPDHRFFLLARNSELAVKVADSSIEHAIRSRIERDGGIGHGGILFVYQSADEFVRAFLGTFYEKDRVAPVG